MILGVDPGSARVGLAVADLETRFARPLEVIETSRVDPIDRIAALVDELGVTTVVVGRPTTLAGNAGPAVESLRGFVTALSDRLPVPVEEHDERLTTVMAERSLRAAGAKSARRKILRDAVAASVMLQGYLDSHP